MIIHTFVLENWISKITVWSGLAEALEPLVWPGKTVVTTKEAFCNSSCLSLLRCARFLCVQILFLKERFVQIRKHCRKQWNLLQGFVTETGGQTIKCRTSYSLISRAHIVWLKCTYSTSAVYTANIQTGSLWLSRCWGLVCKLHCLAWGTVNMRTSPLEPQLPLQLWLRQDQGCVSVTSPLMCGGVPTPPRSTPTSCLLSSSSCPSLWAESLVTASSLNADS